MSRLVNLHVVVDNRDLDTAEECREQVDTVLRTEGPANLVSVSLLGHPGHLVTGSTTCALRAGLPDDDGECGRPGAFVLTDRNDWSWGACFFHVARTLEVMSPNGPVTVQPISSEHPGAKPDYMTVAQFEALREVCWRYRTTFRPHLFTHTFDVPTGYVAGWAGPIYVGCSPEGRISS